MLNPILLKNKSFKCVAIFEEMFKSIFIIKFIFYVTKFSRTITTLNIVKTRSFFIDRTLPRIYHFLTTR